MPRPKVYQNQAQRQAAYRARHPEKSLPTEATLAALARSLHAVLRQAVEQNTGVLPIHLLGARPDETLRNLIYYIDPIKDPIRYFGKEDASRPNKN